MEIHTWKRSGLSPVQQRRVVARGFAKLQVATTMEANAALILFGYPLCRNQKRDRDLMVLKSAADGGGRPQSIQQALGCYLPRGDAKGQHS